MEWDDLNLSWCKGFSRELGPLNLSKIADKVDTWIVRLLRLAILQLMVAIWELIVVKLRLV